MALKLHVFSDIDTVIINGLSRSLWPLEISNKTRNIYFINTVFKKFRITLKWETVNKRITKLMKDLVTNFKQHNQQLANDTIFVP